MFMLSFRNQVKRETGLRTSGFTGSGDKWGMRKYSEWL